MFHCGCWLIYISSSCSSLLPITLCSVTLTVLLLNWVHTPECGMPRRKSPPTLPMVVPPRNTRPWEKCIYLPSSIPHHNTAEWMCCLLKFHIRERTTACTELLLLLCQVTNALSCQKSRCGLLSDWCCPPILGPEWPAVARPLNGRLDDRRDPSNGHPSCPSGAAETRRQDTGRVFLFNRGRSDDLMMYKF